MSARRAELRRQSRAQAHAPAGAALDSLGDSMYVLCCEEAARRAGDDGNVTRAACRKCGSLLWFVESVKGIEFVSRMHFTSGPCRCASDPIVWAYNRNGVKWLEPLNVEDD